MKDNKLNLDEKKQIQKIIESRFNDSVIALGSKKGKAIQSLKPSPKAVEISKEIKRLEKRIDGLKKVAGKKYFCNFTSYGDKDIYLDSDAPVVVSTTNKFNAMQKQLERIKENAIMNIWLVEADKIVKFLQELTDDMNKVIGKV